LIRFEKDQSCLWFPADAGASASAKERPAILFLHGIGERGLGGDDLPLVARWGLPKFRGEGRRLLDSSFPFLVVAPQCPLDRSWCDQDVLDGLNNLLEQMTAIGQADPERIYLTGFSIGGVGAFCVALRWPTRFAAIASVCGACMTPEQLAQLSHLPLWIAYGEDDEIGYLTEGSRDIVARLSQFGRLVERPYRVGASGEISAHAHTCDVAYAEPELYHWLLAISGERS
jgi:predicted peptidase